MAQNRCLPVQQSLHTELLAISSYFWPNDTKGSQFIWQWHGDFATYSKVTFKSTPARLYWRTNIPVTKCMWRWGCFWESTLCFILFCLNWQIAFEVPSRFWTELSYLHASGLLCRRLLLLITVKFYNPNSSLPFPCFFSISSHRH